MYVRDYAPPGKSPRNYSTGSNHWPLAVRRQTVLQPGAPVRVELDLAVKIDGALVLAVVGRPSLVTELGLRPALGMEMHTSAEPLAPLSILLEAPQAEMILSAGTVIAELYILSAPGERLVPDADLDHEMYEPGSGLSFDTSDEAPEPERDGNFPW